MSDCIHVPGKVVEKTLAKGCKYELRQAFSVCVRCKEEITSVRKYPITLRLKK